MRIGMIGTGDIGVVSGSCPAESVTTPTVRSLRNLFAAIGREIVGCSLPLLFGQRPPRRLATDARDEL